nr:immunoglobulin heavy chain junction region [Homo sapiens]
MGVAHTTQT